MRHAGRKKINIKSTIYSVWLNKIENVDSIEYYDTYYKIANIPAVLIFIIPYGFQKYRYVNEYNRYNISM